MPNEVCDPARRPLGERVGLLAGRSPAWSDAAAVTTVLASGGYPGDYRKGLEVLIPGGLEGDGLTVFHAGTLLEEGRLLSSGGRVLAVTAVGASFQEAADQSREAAAAIGLEGGFFRQDIGWRERRRRERA